MNKPMILIWFVITAILLNGPAWGESNSPGIPWGDLSSAEQRVLAPLQKSWDQLPAERQHRMQKGANRWTGMTTQQRQQAQQRLQQWNRLDSQQKDRIRGRFNQFNRLSKEKRQALRQKRQWFKNLPSAQRQVLRKQWERLSPEKLGEVRRGLGLAGNPHLPGATPRPRQSLGKGVQNPTTNVPHRQGLDIKAPRSRLQAKPRSDIGPGPKRPTPHVRPHRPAPIRRDR